MKPNAYRTLALNEEHGWYYEARRRAIARLIARRVICVVRLRAIVQPMMRRENRSMTVARYRQCLPKRR